jgi:hypothetical protein
MLRNTVFIAAVALCIGYGFMLNAQEGTQVPSQGEQATHETRDTVTEKAEVPAAEKVRPADTAKQEKKETRQARKKEEKRPTDKTAAKEETAAAPFNSKGLLLVDEGDESLRRIPDIVIQKRRVAAEDSIVRIPGDAQQKSSEPEHRGFMGMSDDTAKTAAKVSIVVLIFVIYLLYRMRSKGSRRRVMRTFPKK